MATLVLGSIAFGYTFYAVKPGVVVDKLIALFVDAAVPGRGVGESNWFMKNWKSLEQGAEKSSKEMDLRAELRNWDQKFPEMHHELIVRYLCSTVAAGIATGIYDMVRPSRR